MDIHSIWDTLFGETKTYKKQDMDPEMDPAFPHNTVHEIMHKHRDHTHFIAASLSYVDEEYQDAVAEHVFSFISTKARELRHRPRHELPKEE